LGVKPDEARERLSLVVADDYPLFLEGLARRIEEDGRFHLVATATTGPGAVAAFEREQPGVALVGWHLPDLKAVALVERLRAASPGTGLVLLAGVVEPDMVYAAVGLGARGCLAKQEEGPALLDGLARVADGGTAFSRVAESCLVKAVRSRAERSGDVPSPREAEILRLLAGGSTARQIGDELFVSEATVKTHLNRLYGKLSVSDRAAAVASAMRRGWLS
jgi:two-component system, NarL family, nitrate/nitrite response regulator NarL